MKERPGIPEISFISPETRYQQKGGIQRGISRSFKSGREGFIMMKILEYEIRKGVKHFKKEYGYFGYLAERKLDRAAYINDCVLGHPRKSARHMAKHPA